MEGERKQAMQQEKQEKKNKKKKKKKKKQLEVFDILKESVGIFLKNINFIIFTFFCSLPLFCFMVYFETSLQETLAETSEILECRSYPGDIDGLFTKNYALKLIQLGFIYLLPLHILDLCSAIVTIDLASKLRSGDKHMTLKDMFQKSFDISNLRGTFKTSIFVQFLTNCHLLGLLFIVINYFIGLRAISFYGVFAVICSLGFAKLLSVYLEWVATWNMSIVISVLEKIHGIDALVVSGYFNRGCQRRGFFLMLFFFAWGQFLRIPCMFMGCYKRGNDGIIVLQAGLFCVGNLLKWVACMIYFYDCKDRNLKKKVDEELGKDIEAVHESQK